MSTAGLLDPGCAWGIKSPKHHHILGCHLSELVKMHPPARRAHSPPTAGRGGSNSHGNDVSVLHYAELIILLPGPVNDLCQQGPEQKHHKNSQINF